jgi:hypothetical protein
VSSNLSRITDWNALHGHLQHPENRNLACSLDDEIFPFEWPAVDPMEFLSQAIEDENSRLLRMEPGPNFADKKKDDISKEIREMPLEEAARYPFFHLSLFNLSNLVAEGRVLHQMNREVFEPFEERLKANGIGWDRFFPVIFITGPGSGTNYHIDPHSTITFHLFGHKRLYSLKQPKKWCPQEIVDEVSQNGSWPARPDGIREEDCFHHDNEPGDLVLLPVHTPHWTVAESDSFSGTVTFVLSGLKSLR